MSLEHINGPFVHKAVLSDGVLQVTAKHVDECLEWCGKYNCEPDPELETVESMTSSTNFPINFDGEDIFNLLKSHIEGRPVEGVKFTFPTGFKGENEYICIFIDITMTLGKERKTQKKITLYPKKATPESRIFEKIERAENKSAKRTDELCTKINNCESGLNSMIIALDNKTGIAENGLNKRIDELAVKIDKCALTDMVVHEVNTLVLQLGQVKTELSQLGQIKAEFEQRLQAVHDQTIEECKKLIEASKTT